MRYSEVLGLAKEVLEQFEGHAYVTEVVVARDMDYPFDEEFILVVRSRRAWGKDMEWLSRFAEKHGLEVEVVSSNDARSFSVLFYRVENAEEGRS